MDKRVTILHNPTAGFGNYPKDKLLKAFQKKGFETFYTDTKEDDLQESLKNPGDLIVIAGGDGTVKKVASQILGKKTPIGLLPLGTANNIASSLGIKGKPEELVAAWDLDRRKPFDVGLAKTPDRATFFLESAGFGLLPSLIRQHSKDKSEGTKREQELDKALKHQEQILKEYKSCKCTISLNGQELSGNYLLVEILNVRLAGPNMDLAPQADPGDGLLDVVLVREEEREQLLENISAHIRGKDTCPPLNVLRARELKVKWQGNHYHLGGEAYESRSPFQLEFQLIPKALEFLVV